MCGRFAQIEPVDSIAQRLGIDEVLMDTIAPRYNISPGANVVALVHSIKKSLVQLKWGLIPYWVRDISRVKPLINARVETVAVKPSFKKAFFNNRCIILASGFYEWKKEGSKKIPYYITIDDFFGFGGIFDTAIVGGKELRTCAILTTEANDAMRVIHNRMPLIIRQKEFELWIKSETPVDILKELIKPYRGNCIMHPVTAKVNNPAYDEPDCINPA